MGNIQVTQTSSTARLQTDPLRNFKFVVSIQPPSGSAISVGFMSVSGLSVTISVIAYRDGAMNTVTQKLPGQAEFSPIVLSRGLAVGTQFELGWLKQLFQVMQGTASATTDDTAQFPNGPGSEFRATMDVMVLGHPVTGVAAPINAWFRVYNAWPSNVSFSDLDAGANQILVSQMTLAHEGWDLKVSSNISTGVSF